MWTSWNGTSIARSARVARALARSKVQILKVNWSNLMSEANDRIGYRGGYRPSPIAEPRRTFADGRWTVILTRELGHPVKRVWEALTEPGQLQQWAPFTVDRDLAATGEVAITMAGQSDSDGKAPSATGSGELEVQADKVQAGKVQAGKVQVDEEQAGEAQADEEQTGYVLESDPPRLLVYRWGDDQLRWELTATEDGTTLVLSHSLRDEGFTSAVAAGWHMCLDVLDALMKDAPFGPVVGSRAKDYGWDDLNQQYAEILGVKASFT